MQQTEDTSLSSDDRLRFITYLNYIAGVAQFLDEQYPSADELCRVVVSSPGFAAIQGGKCRDQQKVERLFRNAWFTEIQLSLAGNYPDFVVYSNHWAPVQMYYMVYLSIRSFLISSGHEANPDHTTTLTTISEQIRIRHDLFPQPWNVLCLDDPWDNPGYLGLPRGVTIQSVSSLSSHRYVDFWSSYSMFLRTTRERLIEKKCEDWKHKNKKQRVSSVAKKAFIKNQWPTSLFDAMYRLRIRSNYADVDSFLLSLDMDSDAKVLNDAIMNIGWYSTLLFELLAARYLGKACFRNLVNSFVDRDKEKFSSKLISKRWKAIERTWK